MAAELDEVVDGFRNRPLDRLPYTFVWVDALTQNVREGGRTVNVHCLIATGVNADGCREILGIDVTSSEDRAGWLAFLRGLAARGLSGVRLVTSDDHAGLVNAIAAVLPGAAWQRSSAGAAKTSTFLGEKYRRIARRRGSKRAIVALGRSILVIAWHLLSDPEARFHDLGPGYHAAHTDPERRKRSHIRELEALGYTVTLQPAA
jgi:hypothetical protein